ncbi:FkbM family methyltransferase [Pseudarcicella hirudinis]|uniref:FkbM family methyltransferase n=1 Tax=Pseudarcicella hirudinis TaxID=1079859 RepID=UPI0035EF79DB
MFAIRYLLKDIYRSLRTANGRRLIWLFAKYGDVPRYTPKTISFLNFTFLVPDCMSFTFQFKEIFVDEFYQFKAASSTPLIYDCGANIGTSCAYFKNIYPQSKIKAFEADNKIAQILEQNLKINHLKDVEVINKAVWTNDEGIYFASEGSDAASIYGEGEKIKVESVRLKNLLDKESHIDMLKMDIEGAETEVIRDCKDSLAHIQNIFIEYHSFPDQAQHLGEILDILTRSGFRYFVDSPQTTHTPLTNRKLYNGGMDLQLNISVTVLKKA